MMNAQAGFHGFHGFVDRHPGAAVPSTGTAVHPPVSRLVAPRADDAHGERPTDPAWRRYDEAAARLSARFQGLYRIDRHDHWQPERLQVDVPERFRRPYPTSVASVDWGARQAPLLVCVGGVANVAMRFSFLAADLQPHWRVVCMDWLGRGLSGWLADDREYQFETYVEQLRQLLQQLGVGPGRPVRLLGSSMGGSVAMALAAREPHWVSRLVLNDIGPELSRERRMRRAQTLARFHVFRSPDDITRRIGASQKHDGPIPDDIRMFLAHHQTRWSQENAGRIYRHDLRALLSYRLEAERDVDQWDDWRRVECPVLLLHGLESDALRLDTIERMRAIRPLSVAHIPRTGHTPLLSDRHQTRCIGDWLSDPAPQPLAWSVPLAPERRRWTGEWRA